MCNGMRSFVRFGFCLNHNNENKSSIRLVGQDLTSKCHLHSDCITCICKHLHVHFVDGEVCVLLMHAWSASQLTIQMEHSVSERMTQWVRKTKMKGKKHLFRIKYSVVEASSESSVQNCSARLLFASCWHLSAHKDIMQYANIREYQKRLTTPRSILPEELKRSHFSVAMKRVIQKTDT